MDVVSLPGHRLYSDLDAEAVRNCAIAGRAHPAWKPATGEGANHVIGYIRKTVVGVASEIRIQYGEPMLEHSRVRLAARMVRWWVGHRHCPTSSSSSWLSQTKPMVGPQADFFAGRTRRIPYNESNTAQTRRSRSGASATKDLRRKCATAGQ